MNKKEQIDIITRNAQEVVGEEKFPKILEKKKPIVYCGYEPSGEVHLGHLVTINKLIDFQKAGFHVKVLLADWHAWLNRKGDWTFIGEQVKLWKKKFQAAGLTEAEFVVGSSFQRTPEFMDDVLELALKTTMNRALRSMVMVARDLENAHVSQVIYPLMQIADIKHLQVDCVTSGIEQRKIHMLGVELFESIQYETPAFVHTPLISSLQGPGSKMSSSNPDSMISIADSDETIKQKFKKAYCPEGIKEDNPILSIVQLIIFPQIEVFEIKRPEKFGGNVSFLKYDELEKAFLEKNVHPLDLKNAACDYLIQIVSKIRSHL